MAVIGPRGQFGFLDGLRSLEFTGTVYGREQNAAYEPNMSVGYDAIAKKVVLPGRWRGGTVADTISKCSF